MRQKYSLSTSIVNILESLFIGLSKERPILGDHAKAHIFGLRSENTLIKPRRSTWKAHEKHMKSMKSVWKKPLFMTKDHLQGIVTLCFYPCWYHFCLQTWHRSLYVFWIQTHLVLCITEVYNRFSNRSDTLKHKNEAYKYSEIFTMGVNDDVFVVHVDKVKWAVHRVPTFLQW